MPFNPSFALADVISVVLGASAYMLIGMLVLIIVDIWMENRDWPSALPCNPLAGVFVWMLWPLFVVIWCTRVCFYEKPLRWKKR